MASCYLFKRTDLNLHFQTEIESCRDFHPGEPYDQPGAFFLPAIVFRGPLRVLALVFVL